VLSALNHCHYKNISHRDLKPENIVFVKKSKSADLIDLANDEVEIKIIDFGLAKYLVEDKSL
jgi:calcium-dependent protein kinase